MSEAIDNLTKMDVCDLLTSLVGATLFDNNTAPYISQISNRFQHLRDENARLRANLINCAARLEAYYGEDYPAVRDAKAALTATRQPKVNTEQVIYACGTSAAGPNIPRSCPIHADCFATSQEGQHESR